MQPNTQETTNKNSFLTWQEFAIAAVPILAAFSLFLVSLARRDLMEPFFVKGNYWVMTGLVGFWAAVYLLAARGLDRTKFVAWVKDNKAGLIIAAAVTVISVVTVEPALRILADETNLLGVSRNLYYNKTANFATTGKWYYEAFWNLNETMDRRPSLYPYFVSLVHAIRGYSYTNAYVVNAIAIPVFVFVAYRLAKSLGGEAFAMAAAILVAAHPVTLVSARSGGFDFIATVFGLIVIKNFYDYAKSPSANGLAMLWLNMCMLAHIRYEGGGTLIIAVLVLVGLRMLKWENIRPYLVVYAFTPLLLLPRIWQTMLKAGDQEQPFSTVLFGGEHLRENFANYFGVLKTPFGFRGPHGVVIMALGIIGFLLLIVMLNKSRIVALVNRYVGEETGRAAQAVPDEDKPQHGRQFTVFLVAWLLLMALISFAYRWGKPMHPASCRLYVAMDGVFSFTAAYLLVQLAQFARRIGAWLPTVIASLLFVAYVPVAAEARFINELTLTRQAAETWRFFEKLGTKHILVVTDRPGLFTVMEYGSIDLVVAKQSQDLLIELSRRLYKDIYVIQEISLDTNKPLADFEIWPDHPMETVLEFQNTESTSVRVAKIKHDWGNGILPPPAPPAPPKQPAPPEQKTSAPG